MHKKTAKYSGLVLDFFFFFAKRVLVLDGFFAFVAVHETLGVG